MKEFSAQTGGRYTYVDDILNLQNLALAFSSIFNDCDNFVVSGCEVKGTSIGDGYVYINGKLRYFSGVTGINLWPQYIYESNYTETVAYENGADKVGRSIYGCTIARTVPTLLDSLTNAVPQYIMITASGGKQLKDALFGKYALALNPANNLQEVKGSVNFSGEVSVSNALTSKNKLAVKTGNSTGQIYYDGSGNFTVQSSVGDGNLYKFVISENNGFQFIINGQIIWVANSEMISHKIPFIGNTGKFGNIKTTSNYIYNENTSTDSGALYINTLGYNGGSQYFRDTYIGNGKSGFIIEIKGKDALVNINGTLKVAGIQPVGMVLRSNYSRLTSSLRKTISWIDNTDMEFGYIGYNSISNNIFEIQNKIANVSITGSEAVNLGPSIMENGTLLANKYATIAYVKEQLGLKANYNPVFEKVELNTTLASLEKGLTQFGSSKAVLRSEIGAVSEDDVKKMTVSLDKHLSDLVKTEDDKRKICFNIGATYKEDYQKKLNDSGWVQIKDQLYIRQIGNVVSIQGFVVVIQSGVVFSIPNSIDPPIYAVNYSTILDDNGGWRCHLAESGRDCIVDFCSKQGAKMPFSITYMV